jgi:hypothetical protein
MSFMVKATLERLTGSEVDHETHGLVMITQSDRREDGEEAEEDTKEDIDMDDVDVLKARS